MKKTPEIKYQELGKCPACGSESLSYEDLEAGETISNEVCYEFTCDDCGIGGKEWYSLHYIETTIEGQNK